MRRLSRRSFNTAVGAGYLLAPFVSTLLERPARAQPPAKRAKRLCLFCTMGTAPVLWSPTDVSGENSFSFTPSMAPLAAIKKDLVLVEGLASANPGSGHGFPDALTGKGYVGKIISVDQYLSDQLRAQGINRPIPVLLLGADAHSGGQSMFNRDQNLFPITSPLQAFNTVFGNVMGAGPSPMSPDLLLKRRKSILDVIRGEINGLAQTIGAAEKAKLDL